MNENMLVALLCVLYKLHLKPLIIWVRNYLFLKIYATSEGAVSHNVWYYQKLSIACYQVSFYANYFFEKSPKVSSAFKKNKQWGQVQLAYQSQSYISHQSNQG